MKGKQPIKGKAPPTDIFDDKGDISQDLYNKSMWDEIDNIVLPPPLSRVEEPLDETNEHLPGFVYRDNIKRDEQGLLMKSYIRLEGFSAPFINGYNQTVDIIRHHLLTNFNLVLSNGHKIEIKTVIFNTPNNSDGSPVYPSQVETGKVSSYLAPIEVIYGKSDENGTEYPYSKKNGFGAFPIMTGSVLCNLYPSRLIQDVYGDEGAEKWKTVSEDDRNIMYQKALMSVGESMHDPLGWYVVEGMAKTILSQAKLRTNVPILAPTGTKGVVTSKFTSVTTSMSTVIEVKRTHKPENGNLFKLKMPGVDTKKQKHISIVAIYYMFGVTEVSDMIALITRVVPPAKQKYIEFQLNGMHSKLYKITHERPGKWTDIYSYVRYKRISDINIGSKYKDVLTNDELVNDIRNNLFVHMNDMYPKEPDEARTKQVNDMKLNLLSLMVARLAMYFMGQHAVEDRDSWAHKRIETGARAFLSQYIGIVDKFRAITQEMINSKHIVDLETLTRCMKPNMMTEDSVQVIYGNVFGFKSPNKSASTYKVNVTEPLKRESLLSQYSQIRRINTPANRQMKQTPARSVHSSQFMAVCASESPEGGRIGLVNNLAITCAPTLEHDDKLIHRQITTYKSDEGMGILNSPTLTHTHILLLNGKFLGWVRSDLHVWARDLKIRGVWPRETCIVHTSGSENMISIYTDSQRPMFPLIRIVNGQLMSDTLPKDKRVSFQSLLDHNAIEYIDSWELDNIQIAHDKAHLKMREEAHVIKKKKLEERIESATEQDRPGYQKELKHLEEFWDITHMVIDPTAASSISTALIPMFNHATAARNTYGASMGKQALGIYRTNTFTQFPTTAKSLANPTKPVFKTQMDEDIGHNDMAHGTMANVAVMPYLGVNDEDAFIINRDTLDKFASIKEFSKTAIISGQDKHDTFGLPMPPSDDKYGKYAHIDPKTGAARVGTYLKEGMVVIARYSKQGVSRENTSIVMGVGEEGMVSTVLVTTKITHKMEVKKIVRVKLYKYRIPQVGDKFTSRYAQKTTIGRILSGVDMPRTEPREGYSGIVPDIIINPLPLANRMTINKAYELFGSKPAAMQGVAINGTAFRMFSLSDMVQYMETQGFKGNGTETMFNPYTGKEMTAKIMIGPCYYQVLRHQVADKSQARGSGGRQMHTGQTTRGRSEGGAIRFGVMERTALFSYGASALTKERLMISSDVKEYVSCTKCSSMTIPDVFRKSGYRCADRTCESSDFVTTKIPHSLLYLKYILAAGNFVLDINVVKPTQSEVPVDIEEYEEDQFSADDDEEEAEQGETAVEEGESDEGGDEEDEEPEEEEPDYDYQGDY